MKICIVSDKHFIEKEPHFALELKKLGHSCFFICDIKNNYKNVQKFFPVLPVKFWQIENNALVKNNVIKFFKKIKFNIVLSDTLFPAGYFGYLAKKSNKKITNLVFPTGADIQYFPKIKYGFKNDARKNKLINLTTKYFDGYLFGAKQLKNDFYKNWQPNDGHKIWYVPAGHATPSYKTLEKEKLQNKYGLENKFIILTLSRLHPKKNIKHLIKIMPTILKKDKKFHLIIAGNYEKLWYKERLKQEIKKYKLENNVQLIGKVTGRKKKEIFLLSSIFIIPSVCEVVPATLLESFHYGLPVISTPVGHSIDLIKQGKNGFLVPHNKPNTLCDKILSLKENSNLRKIIAANGKITAEKHRWKNCINKWVEVFEEAINIVKNK